MTDKKTGFIKTGKKWAKRQHGLRRQLIYHWLEIERKILSVEKMLHHAENEKKINQYIWKKNW